MSLLITAYLRPALIDTSNMSEELAELLISEGGAVRIWKDQKHPERAIDLVNHSIYSYENKFDVQFNTYKDYDDWLEQLAEVAGYQSEPVTDGTATTYLESVRRAKCGPFRQLLDFTHSTGALGIQDCLYLHHDFCKFIPVALTQKDEYWLKCYRDLTVAFQLAASFSGFVQLH